jgi:AcrR family transcriptional regulator
MKHEATKTAKENVAENIIHATLELATAEGWQAVSIRKIAARIQYSTMVIYEHFGNKTSLLQSIQKYGFKKLLADYTTRLRQELTAKEAILVLSNSTWTFAEQHPELYTLMFGLSGMATPCDPQQGASATAQYVRHRLSDVFQDDLNSVFMNWWALVHGFIMIKFIDGYDAHLLKIYFDDAMRRFVETAR